MRTFVLVLALGLAVGAVALAAPAAEAHPCLPDPKPCAENLVCDLFFNGCGPCWPECAEP